MNESKNIRRIMPYSSSLPTMPPVPANLLKQAREFDAEDTLSEFRSEFSLPPSCTYLCGNSLGPQPKRTAKALGRHIDKWASLGVEGHFEQPEPWATIEEEANVLSMDIVGAKYKHEIAIMNSLSVNIHLMLTSFYRPNGKRKKILIEYNAFPSDDYAVQSHIQSRGFTSDVEDCIIRLKPREEQEILNTDDIIDSIKKHDDDGSLALVLFPGIQFYTGQIFPMKRIASECRKRNIPFGLDLAHAVGNIPLSLHEWDADFAIWCSYKYLNSGPGAIAGLFLHDRYKHTPLPKLIGWWAHERHSRFKMPQQFESQAGAPGYQLSNPSVFSIVPLIESLKLFKEAGGVKTIRRKSVKLTRFLRQCINDQFDGCADVDIITPANEDECGSQLSVRVESMDCDEVNAGLKRCGFICDVRKPNVVRVAPNGLYNSFEEVCLFVTALHSVVLHRHK